MIEALYEGVIFWITLVILLSFHEYGHAKFASMLGDKTAEYAGRMTLNPGSHIDPVGTVMLPLMIFIGNISGARMPFFGWAKPVPVDAARMSRRDMMIIAFSGPLMNILCAIGIVIILKILLISIAIPFKLKWIIQRGAHLSLFLAFFNLLPISPLDGYSVLYGLLPYRYAKEFARTERYGMMILMAIIFIPWVLPTIPNVVFGTLSIISIKILRLMLAILRIPWF